MPKDQPVRTPNAHHIQTSSLLLAPDVIVISTVGFFKLTVMKIIIIAAQLLLASCASPPPARRSPEKDEMGRSLPVARLVRPPTHARLMCSRRTRKIPGPRLDPIFFVQSFSSLSLFFLADSTLFCHNLLDPCVVDGCKCNKTCCSNRYGILAQRLDPDKYYLEDPIPWLALTILCFALLASPSWFLRGNITPISPNRSRSDSHFVT